MSEGCMIRDSYTTAAGHSNRHHITACSGLRVFGIRLIIDSHILETING